MVGSCLELCFVVDGCSLVLPCVELLWSYAGRTLTRTVTSPRGQSLARRRLKMSGMESTSECHGDLKCWLWLRLRLRYSELFEPMLGHR